MKYAKGQQFEKIGGDYRFKGEIVAGFTKKDGVVRYVGENDDGLLFIFNEIAIRPVNILIYPDGKDPLTLMKERDLAILLLFKNLVVLPEHVLEIIHTYDAELYEQTNNN